MRNLVVEEFQNWVVTSNPDISTVAVVGGTSADPEIAVVKRHFPEATIHFLGIDNSRNDSNYLDLDLNSAPIMNVAKFDLVINSQVLEHVWNLANAFENLANLTKPDGFLWVNCPASNMAHGSPAYYSAGYTDGYIAENLKYRNFEILISKTIGSKRNYFMTHILRHWPAEAELKHPVLNYNFQPGSFLGVIRKYLRDLPGRLLSVAFSNRVVHSIDYATESVVLAKLRES
ncbi:Methyltransferase domain containing protein [Candidatus Nanopelagicaceae bacterium]